MKRLNLGLLKCDSFIPEIKKEYGDIDIQFKNLLNANTLNTKVDLSVFELVEDEFPLKEDILKGNRYHGFVISGSRSSVNDDKPWIHKLKEYIKFFNENKIKTVGICFGHQAIASALPGGSVISNDKGWQVSDHQFSMNTSQCKDIKFLENYNQLYNNSYSIQENKNIICLNKQIVSSVPDGFKVLASNELCDNHMMIKDKQFLSFQGHPEFTPNLIKSLILSRRGIIPDLVIEDGVERANNSKIQQDLYPNLIISFFQDQ
ncbi:glutamine amidotransferase class-I domain-containing protein [Tieghemostelium lacteum]|uniref:Glutamine amidotransferase class-I domain-containing protein n=1 Tax=Tieghemostelium lacteum TaxID=361077 RepID=A0A152A4H3_TIELA|nr:glutamine amidotransferase class-I domain-containing protein [Tieghemostelium lacteum]|eukprot:KYR00987.1 glutamine amidotransferase class-I domain-containing protein [Tieghemostelium lacteum]